MAISRRPNNQYQETVELIIDHVQVTANTVFKAFKTHPTRRFRIDRIDYVNPAGLAQDAANFFVIALKTGSTVLGSWSTATAGQGTIAADTFVALVLNATDANLVVANGSVISVDLAETGTATLPAGKFVVHGRYV